MAPSPGQKVLVRQGNAPSVPPWVRAAFVRLERKCHIHIHLSTPPTLTLSILLFTVLYSTVLYNILLYCTIHYCTLLHCIYCIVLHSIIHYCITLLYSTVLYYIFLHCTIPYCKLLYFTVLYPTILIVPCYSR